MDLKRHFIKKYWYTLLFLCFLFGYAGVNGWKELPALREWVVNVKSFEDMNLYPVDGNLQNPSGEKEVPGREAMEQRHERGVAAAVKELETIIDENAAGKHAFIELYGLGQLVLDKREENNFSYVKDSRGYLYSGPVNRRASREQSYRYAAMVERIAQMGTARGSRTLAVIPPVNAPGDRRIRETGLFTEYETRTADGYREALEDLGIACVDFGKTLAEHGFIRESIFYRTDHHWTSQAAFDAFGSLVEEMDRLYAINWDKDGFYRDPDNYNHVTYKDSFLGSGGRETGILYAGGLEDFTVIFPKFGTDIEYQYWSGGITQSIFGRVEDCLLFTDHLTNQDIYENDKYSVYMNGVLEQDRIVNRGNPYGPVILFIRDSFSSPLAVFLTPLCSQIDMVWGIRYNGDLEELMRENHYDYVIVSTSVINLSDHMYPFLEQTP